MMTEGAGIVLHSKQQCPFCVKAKEFLTSHVLSFQEIDYNPVDESYEKMRDVLIAQTGSRTFPQIFVGNVFIGGYSDMIHMYDTQKFHDICKKELNVDLPRSYDF